jgi:hypothetical protein
MNSWPMPGDVKRKNMVRRITTGVFFVLAMALAACGAGEAGTTPVSGAAVPEGMTVSVSTRLSLGTLMLEGTAGAVTPAQAQELLPLWQMVRALGESGTSAQAETEAVVHQIQAVMTAEQLAAIEAMTQEDMQSLMQGSATAGEGDTADSSGGDGRLPEMVPPEGGQGPVGMGPGGLGDLSLGQQASLVTERTNSGMRTAQVDQVIELLEWRSAEL